MVIRGLVIGLVGRAGECGGRVWKVILIWVAGTHVSQGAEIRKYGNTELRDDGDRGQPRGVVAQA